MSKKPWDQNRADKLAQYIRETRPQTSQAKIIEAINNREGIVFHAMYAHDDWCPTLKTGSSLDCTCDPDVSFYREPNK